MEHSFQIFEPEKGLYISFRNWIAIIGALGLVVLWLMDHYTNQNLELYPLFFTMLFIVYMMFQGFANSMSEKPPRGKFNGFLKFSEDAISLRENKYDLSVISRIKFKNFQDLKGAPRFITGEELFFRKMSLNGTSNELVLELESGETVNCHFLQTESSTLKKVKQLLISYSKMGKITESEVSRCTGYWDGFIS